MMQTRKSEAGFTLIELLVVITILGVLFGLVALKLTGVGSNAETNAMKAEWDMVQTAIDVYMTTAMTTTVTGNGVADYVGPASGDEFSPYLRRVSKYQYTWDSTGTVTGQVKP